MSSRDASAPDLAQALFSALETTLAASRAVLDAAVGNLGDIPAASKPDSAASEGSNAAKLTPTVARALLAAMESSTRYWGDLAALCGRHQTGLLQLLGAATRPRTEQENRIGADELRAFLRELGDLATIEAQRLRQELMALSQSVADDFAPPDGEPVRRWRAKP